MKRKARAKKLDTIKYKRRKIRSLLKFQRRISESSNYLHESGAGGQGASVTGLEKQIEKLKPLRW